MNANTLRMFFIGSGVVIFGLVAQGHMTWVSATKQSNDLAQAKSETLQVQLTDIEVAESRFKNGCTFIGVEGGGTPVQISLGMAVYGHSAEGQRNPLADGTVVCDRWGGTAVMQGGAAVQFASSPNYLRQNPYP